MTYILGWKNYNSVFLVGDSIITFEQPKPHGSKNTFRDKSTFGEDHIYEEGKTVSETYLKLYDLNDKVILAISGDLMDAYEGIKYFQFYLENNTDLELAFENSFKDRDVGIIAGYMDDEVPRLISYNLTGNGGINNHSFFEVVYSGSINGNFISQTEDFFSQIEAYSWNNDQILTTIIAVVQSFCFQDEVIRQGVGGFFSGIRISKDGVNWQKDLAFVPFSYNGKDLRTSQLAEIFGEAKIVMTQVKDSILYSCSPFLEDVRKARRPFSNFQLLEVIESNNWSKERKAWAAKWGNEINSNCDEFLADYYIFYNTEKPVVAMVWSNETKPFEISERSLKFEANGFLGFIEHLFNQQDDDLTLYTHF